MLKKYNLLFSIIAFIGVCAVLNPAPSFASNNVPVIPSFSEMVDLKNSGVGFDLKTLVGLPSIFPKDTISNKEAIPSLASFPVAGGRPVVYKPLPQAKTIDRPWIKKAKLIAAKKASASQKKIASNPTYKEASLGSALANTISKAVHYVSATAYSSTVKQTDTSPCKTANGFDVCKNGVQNVIAANFLPFGTKVKFPDVFGDQIFVVQDRMAARFTNRVDFWMKSHQAAVQFGYKKQLRMEVVEK